MKISPIKTKKITKQSDFLSQICSDYLSEIPDQSIVVVASKIVSLCEGRVVSDKNTTRQQLAEQEADAFIPTTHNKYHYLITLKNNRLVGASGIDNGAGEFILWPNDPQASANTIRKNLKQLHPNKHIGVIIADTHSVPLMRGTIGLSLAHSGFLALNDYRGKKDIYQGIMQSTVVNVAEAIAGAAVLVMGEGSEQTPLAIVEDLPFVQWQNHAPSVEELEELHIDLDDDLFAPLLTSQLWQKNKKSAP